MKKYLLPSIVVLTLALLLTSCGPTQEEPIKSQMRTMNVTGSGKIILEPDIARVNIGVSTQSSRVHTALSENSALARTFINNLVDMGIDINDIQTIYFSIYPQQTYQPGPEEALKTTFVVENTVSVTVRDLDILGEVLAKAVQEGAKTIYGVTFDIEERESAQETARQLAIQDALSQAEAIAEAASVQLGPIQSISTSQNGTHLIYEAPVAEQSLVSSVPISSGTLSIQVTVTLTYQIH